MITGVHAIIYSRDAQADRAFLRDIIGWSSVDAVYEPLRPLAHGG